MSGARSSCCRSRWRHSASTVDAAALCRWARTVPALDVLFRVAYGAYLPSLVGKEAIVGANSRLSASAAVAEMGGFPAAGWLVRFPTAPLAVAIDADSFWARRWQFEAYRSPSIHRAHRRRHGFWTTLR